MLTAAQLVAMSEDEFQALLVREAGDAIRDWLAEAVSPNRPFRSLTQAELDGMACAAISRWIVVRSYRHAAGHPDSALFR